MIREVLFAAHPNAIRSMIDALTLLLASASELRTEGRLEEKKCGLPSKHLITTAVTNR